MGHLVLSRAEGQTIVITSGQDVLGRIMVTTLQCDKVRLGLDFPKWLGVHRLEVWESILRDNNRQLEKDLGE